MAKRVRIGAAGAAGGMYFASPKSSLRFIETGCKPLDLVLGGGWAVGRIANIVGDKSTGKTLLCIEACANFIRKYPKGRIRYWEAEAAFDKPYAAALGMPVDKIDFGDDKDPIHTVEDFFERLTIVAENAKTHELVILDSLDALSDRSEIDRDIDKGTYGGDKAKKMSELFRRLVRKLEKANVTVIIVSQVRDKIGAMFGRKTTRSGGRALDFYASQVLYLAHIGRISKTVSGQKRTIGVRVKAMTDKNKVGLPFRDAEFEIRFGYGIDDVQACLDWMVSSGLVKETGYKKEDIKFFLNSTLLKMEPDEAQEELNRLRELVETHWYRIEQKMLPVRSKYGA